MIPERQRLDLRRAPLLGLQVAADPLGVHWYALLQLHHLIGDHESLWIIVSEVMAHLEGRAHELPEPVPYRIHVTQVLARTRSQEAEVFFRSKLGKIDERQRRSGCWTSHGDGGVRRGPSGTRIATGPNELARKLDV